MNGNPWTPEEDDVLRRHYARRRGGAKRCAKLLPHRTLNAVRTRAKVILPRQRREVRWTLVEDRTLTLHWGESPRLLRERLPGRTWAAIQNRAEHLRLPVVARVEGVVSLAAAARAMGYAIETLATILAAQGVRVEHYHGGAHAERRIRAPKSPRYAVDLDEAREAVERHLAERARTETLTEAAARVETSRSTMATALRAAGVDAGPRRAHRRLDPAAVDRAWAAWCARPRLGVVRCGAGETREERAA